MIKGKIIDINADGSAIIQAPIDPYILTHRKVKECYVDFIDSRPLSDKQRRMCYTLMKAIADWSTEPDRKKTSALCPAEKYLHYLGSAPEQSKDAAKDRGRRRERGYHKHSRHGIACPSGNGGFQNPCRRILRLERRKSRAGILKHYRNRKRQRVRRRRQYGRGIFRPEIQAFFE